MTHPLRLRFHSSVAQEGNGMLFLHTLSRAILDTFICGNSQSSTIINSVLHEEEFQQIHSSQLLTPDGRFMCRSPGCPSTFKHDGKRRRDHEEQHDPPPTTSEVLLSDSTSESTVTPTDKKTDDTYYNCCLLSYGLLFVEFLDAIAEGVGDKLTVLEDASAP